MPHTQIDIRQILITNSIKIAVIEHNNLINFTKFILSNENHDFKLSRMKQMMSSKFDNLLQNEPVQLKIIDYTTYIDGVESKIYEIINGRHRVARAIIENRKFIPYQLV